MFARIFYSGVPAAGRTRNFLVPQHDNIRKIPGNFILNSILRSVVDKDYLRIPVLATCKDVEKIKRDLFLVTGKDEDDNGG
jgi:hypothetical protein